MADIIPFPSREPGETQNEFDRRVELIVKLWPPLGKAIREMHDLGADGPQVIRMLRAAIEIQEEKLAKEIEDQR